MALHLIRVDECTLIGQVGEVLVTALAQYLKDLDELVILANSCRSASVLKLQAWRDGVAAGALEEDSLLRNTSNGLHLIGEVDALSEDAADAP